MRKAVSLFIVVALCLCGAILTTGCSKQDKNIQTGVNEFTSETATIATSESAISGVSLSTDEIAILSTAGHPAKATKELDDTQNEIISNWTAVKDYAESKGMDISSFSVASYTADDNGGATITFAKNGKNIGAAITVDKDGKCTDNFILLEAQEIFENELTNKFSEKYGNENVYIETAMTLKDGVVVSDTDTAEDLLTNGTLVFTSDVVVNGDAADAYDWLTNINQLLADEKYSALTNVSYTTSEYFEQVKTTGNTNNTRNLSAKYTCTARNSGKTTIFVLKGE